MEKYRVIEIKQSIFADNDKQADILRGKLKEKGVFLLNLMSSPGAGKTTTLSRTIEMLKSEMQILILTWMRRLSKITAPGSFSSIPAGCVIWMRE